MFKLNFKSSTEINLRKLKYRNTLDELIGSSTAVEMKRSPNFGKQKGIVRNKYNNDILYQKM